MTSAPADQLPAAASAFDSIAEVFDARFGPWLSVAWQRQAVRFALAKAFPVGSCIMEIGGGTGDDALWLARQGRSVFMTDVSPAMVRIAADKLRALANTGTAVAAAEQLETLATARQARQLPQFDGAYSNFAALNCVTDLDPVARGLARLVRPGGTVLLVVFGTFCPGEMIVEGLRRRPRNMFRRFARGDVPARLGGNSFLVRYHRKAAINAAMSPWFAPQGRQGIGVFVPPSAAEPIVSRWPRLVGTLAAMDHVASVPLAMFGDHILYRFVRTDAVAT